MCWFLTLSKYICVPIIVEWLNEDSILRLESAISNRQLKTKLTELLKEYSKLLCDNIFNSNNEMSLSHACTLSSRWSTKPDSVKCKIHIGTFDLVVLRKKKLTQVASMLIPLMKNVSCNVLGEEEEFLVKLMTLMKSVTTLDATNSSTFDIIKATAVNCNLLTSIKFDICDKENRSAIIAVCRQCPLISTLEIGCLLDWTVLTAVVVHCRHLQQLIIPTANKGYTTYRSALPFWFAFHSSRKLRTWNSSHPLYQFPSKFLLVLWYRGSQLTSLDLTPDTMKVLASSPLGTMCPRLESIQFNSNSSYASNVEYHNSIVSTVRDCPSIQSIHLLKITNPTDETLLSLATHCNTQLREFHLDGRTPFPFSLTGVQLLCAKCTRISTLVLLNLIISDEMVVSIVSLCPNLSELGLMGCTDVTDCCLQLMAPHCKNLLKCTFDCDVVVTEEGLNAVAAHCIYLDHLILSHCDYIDATSCAALMNATALRTLEICDLTVHPPEDRSLSCMPPLGASITTLILNNVYLTDSSLEWLVAQCPRLVLLDVSSNHLLTSSVFVNVAPFLKRLRTLYLSMCKKLTDPVADAIVAHCRRLEHLSLLGTSISNFAIERIERKCETLLCFKHDGCNV